MFSPALLEKANRVLYPESDGQPMSDNTKQFRWIVTLADNLQALFHDHPDVFVCGNQNWYPVEGEPEICVAPDVYAVFGRPKGDRSSYMQWKEDNIPLTVVFEVLSPSNDGMEMTNKYVFYEEHGVEEYYLYDPDRNRLQGFRRQGEIFRRLLPLSGFVSPRLGIRFDLTGPELMIYYPDGRPFLTFEELERQRRQAVQLADQERQRADQAVQRADQAVQRADQEKQRADQEKQRAARLAELSGKLLRQQATSEEMQELQQLSEEHKPASPPEP